MQNCRAIPLRHATNRVRLGFDHLMRSKLGASRQSDRVDSITGKQAIGVFS